MLGGGWVKGKGKRVRDKKSFPFPPYPLPHLRCQGVLLVSNQPTNDRRKYAAIKQFSSLNLIYLQRRLIGNF
ncbi:hypothetical protein NSTC731_02604 [Nostoc sp. DSM 114167]|jgi:hypothetical protein